MQEEIEKGVEEVVSVENRGTVSFFTTLVFSVSINERLTVILLYL
jgi:hypothetical protein